MQNKTIAWINVDIKNRFHEFSKGEYPKSHLWGFIDKKNGVDCILNPLSESPIFNRLCKLFQSITKNRIGDSLVEISLLNKIKKYDAIYCVSGNLFFIPLLKKFGLIKTRLILLLYKLPEPTPWWKFHHLNHSIFIIKAYNGINCLTKKLEQDLKKRDYRGFTQFIEWTTDEVLFSTNKPLKGKYFFSTGKTNRDFKTYFNAIKKIPDIRFKCVAHTNQNFNFPKNLEATISTTCLTDKALSYKQLKETYDKCIAVCIPLTGDVQDTCGYTECLEAMAMGKPVIMTKSGCLDLNLEKEGVGLYVKPNDSEDWVNKIKSINKNPRQAQKMGEKGRRLVEKIYNIKSHQNRVFEFLTKCLVEN
jgi:glycosyltransferase involved in cell wall biosynthesis